MTEPIFSLRRPPKIRRRIYEKVGLFCDYKIDLSDTDLNGEWSARERKLRGGDTDLANQLFYVSRGVSEDARAMFYSENKFWLSDQGRWGLRNLMDLSPLGWKSLTFISIRLRAKFCTGPDGDCYGSMDEIIRRGKRFAQKISIPSDWLYICAQLATYQQDDQLELYLNCDAAASKETATAFLDPLRSLPRLKACSIRLGPYWNPTLDDYDNYTTNN